MTRTFRNVYALFLSLLSFIVKPFDFVNEKAVTPTQVEYFDVILSVFCRVVKQFQDKAVIDVIFCRTNLLCNENTHNEYYVKFSK